MGKKRKKKKDAGTVIFRLIGIELLVLTAAIAVLGLKYLPGLIVQVRKTVTGQQQAGDANQQQMVIEDNAGQQSAAALQASDGNTGAADTAIMGQSETRTLEAAETVSEVEEEEEGSVRLVAVGDNLMHRSSTLSGKHSDGSYSYYDNFCNVRDLFKNADLAVLSQDTVMAGEEYGVTSGDVFTTVTQIGDSIADAGINVVLAANNHILDMGKDGLINMIDYWKINYPEVALLGVNRDAKGQEAPVYVEENGIRIAMINYTGTSNRTDALAGDPYLVNLEDEAWLTDMLTQAGEEADFVIVYPHWNTQDSTKVTEDQTKQAQFLADMGADLIIGTYPHAAEPVCWLTGKDGNQTLVYYSLGNFQSVQDKTINMLGEVAEVTITKTNKRTYISDCGMDFLVTHYAKQPQSTNDYFDVVTTFPWNQYSEELASQHGILAWDPNFSYDALKTLRSEILDQCDFEIK